MIIFPFLCIKYPWRRTALPRICDWILVAACSLVLKRKKRTNKTKGKIKQQSACVKKKRATGRTEQVLSFPFYYHFWNPSSGCVLWEQRVNCYIFSHVSLRHENMKQQTKSEWIAASLICSSHPLGAFVSIPQCPQSGKKQKQVMSYFSWQAVVSDN